jgi:hypothetical protein
MEFGCETPLLAEMPKTRQHFFSIFPDFFILPLVNSPAAPRAKAGEGTSFS